MRNVLYLFGKFSDQDIDWLREAGTREDIPEGGLLIREGQPVETVYITLAGSFAVLVDGERALVAEVGPGEIIGELSFLDSRPPAASVRAKEPSVVLAFTVKRLRTKIRLDLGFASRFYFALATMLADRTRSSLRRIAPGSKNSLDQGVEADGEISPDVLNDASLAAARFDRMRRAFLGE